MSSGLPGGRPIADWTELLVGFDDVDLDSYPLEQPANWRSRYDAETQAAVEFAAELCRRLGYRDAGGSLDWGGSDPAPPEGTTLYFESGSHVQDATYHSELRARSFSSSGSALVFGLRFSNFGHMIGLTPWGEPRDDVVAAIAELATERGYMFIPAEILRTEYPNREHTGYGTWWDRFFDYT